jgi:hypothetical protein
VTGFSEAEYWRYEAERELADILRESMYLAADQHTRRAAYILGELEMRDYRIVKDSK